MAKLLQENGYAILQENGYFILLDFIAAPSIEIRDITYPYNIVSSLSFIQSKDGSGALPVLQGEMSLPVLFRIYNNFATVSEISNAFNVGITVYDGALGGASMPPASQCWLHVMEDGFGQSTSFSTDPLTKYIGEDTTIGGLNIYYPEKGSDGIYGLATISGESKMGGYIQVKSYLTPANDAVGDLYSFVIGVIFEYIN